MNNSYPYPYPYLDVDPCPCDEDGWKESANGNWTHIGPAGVVDGTVFLSGCGHWQIIVQKDLVGRLVADEFFKNSDVARARAEAIFRGAPCTFLPFRNTVR